MNQGNNFWVVVGTTIFAVTLINAAAGVGIERAKAATECYKAAQVNPKATCEVDTDDPRRKS